MVVRFQRNRVVGTRTLGVAYIHGTKILGTPHYPRGKNNLMFPKHSLSRPKSFLICSLMGWASHFLANFLYSCEGVYPV